MLFLCISSELSRSCVWCAEAHGGRIATLNVCNPHKEIVSGRSGPVNSFLACQPCSYPTSQRWAITSDHIYFLDTFYTHARTHIYTPFLPPQTPLLQQDRTSSVCNHTYRRAHPLLPQIPSPRIHSDTHSHSRRIASQMVCVGQRRWHINTTITSVPAAEHRSATEKQQQMLRSRLQDYLGLHKLHHGLYYPGTHRRGGNTLWDHCLPRTPCPPHWAFRLHSSKEESKTRGSRKKVEIEGRGREWSVYISDILFFKCWGR